MLRLTKATIVILAQSHNPSIISPEWVRRVLSIDESPGNFVHTPPFSIFDSTSYLLTVDTARLELVSKSLDDEHISATGRVASAYLRALPHIPYKTLGMNYIWTYSLEKTDKRLPQLRLEIDGLDLEKTFKAQNIRYGGILRIAYKPYILTVNINYEGEQTVIFNYNFSYTMKTARQAANATKSFLPSKVHSEELTTLMIGGIK